MFAGRNPVSGEQLGKVHAANGRPAFDLVFRPVKSVSLLWAFGDEHVRRAVKDAHDRAVRAALRDLEQEVGTRRGAGGRTRIEAQGFLAAGYDHRQSRANDPLLHTHMIIANRVQGADGKWTTIDGRDLYYEALGADATYVMEYQYQLSRSLGVEWGPPNEAGNREIAGISEEAIRHFSKRAEAIDLVREHRQKAGESWSQK
jgi:conjugative relaxase-like TrwC/TraI family protein